MSAIGNQAKETRYQCMECGFHYHDRATAEQCEAWCREHKSCNLKIIQHAEEIENQDAETSRIDEQS